MEEESAAVGEPLFQNRARKAEGCDTGACAPAFSGKQDPAGPSTKISQEPQQTFLVLDPGFLPGARSVHPALGTYRSAAHSGEAEHVSSLVGADVGADGAVVGLTVGKSVGLLVGRLDGPAVGAAVGFGVGTPVAGLFVGTEVGLTLGAALGACVGLPVVGAVVG